MKILTEKVDSIRLFLVTDVYSHIIDDDRRRNAERLAKVLSNPEMAALLSALAKGMEQNS